VSIPAGVTIAMEADARLLVAGVLQVFGSTSQKVTFESAKTPQAAGDWIGIVVDSGGTPAATGNFRHVIIRHAVVGIEGELQSGISVWDSLIEKFEDFGVKSGGGVGFVERNTILGDTCSGTRSGAGISFIGNAAGALAIRDNTIRCLDRGMYLDSDQPSLFTVTGNQVSETDQGIVVRDPLPNMSGNTIFDNEVGILLWGGGVIGGASVRNNSIYDNGDNLELLGYGSGGTPRLFDFSENWWGTTNAAAIYASFDLGGAGSPPSAIVGFSNFLDDVPGSGTPSGSNHATDPLESVTPGAALAFAPRTPESFPVTVELRSDCDVTLWVCPGYQSACNASAAIRTQFFFGLSGSLTGTPHNLSWDGKNDGGGFVADGVYSFAIRAADPLVPALQETEDPQYTQRPGDLKYLNFAQWPGYSATTAAHESPNVFENRFAGVSYTVGSENPQDLDVRTLQWIYLTQAPGGVENPNYLVGPVYVTPSENGTLLWDGRVGTSGFFQGGLNLRFHGQHAQKPNFVIVRGSVPQTYSATGTIPEIEVQANPFRQYHSYAEVSTIAYRLTRDANVRIFLLPIGVHDPSPVFEVQASTFTQALENGVPKVHTFRFDNVNAADPGMAHVNPEGEHTFVIEATDPAPENSGLKSTYRGVLQLRR
jgi:hypothetical protein